jgi:hypothetical protein
VEIAAAPRTPRIHPIRMRHSMSATRLLLLAACVTMSACQRDAGAAARGTWTASIDTIGDTLVVRTERGSVWVGDPRFEPVLRIGELDGPEEFTFGAINAIAVAPDGPIYVLDRQALVVRSFDRQGRHLRSFGGRGAGPGELSRPTGMALLPDGRVLVSDPLNTRVNVYSPEGESLDSWPMGGGFITNDQVRTTRDGRAYVLGSLTPPGETMRTGLVRIGPAGTPADTLGQPEWPQEPPVLIARRVTEGRSAMSSSVLPFAPQGVWSFSPLGYVVGGYSDRYAFSYTRDDGRVVRIERVVEPVAVTAGERAFREHQTTTSMRGTDPAWRWSGPAIPATKAPFTSIRPDGDGRFWVRVAAAGEVVPVEERAELRPGQEPGPEPWREPVVFDVFDPDGAFLGSVRMPPRFTWYGASGDEVWGTLRDEYDVQYVTIMRLAHGEG